MSLILEIAAGVLLAMIAPTILMYIAIIVIAGVESVFYRPPKS